MNTRKNFALRKARNGKGFLPPNPTRWEHEHNGLDVRHQLSLSPEDRFSHQDAFVRLLPDVIVVSHLDLPIDASRRDHFSGARSSKWSGMCAPCPDGTMLVIYNGGHPETRIRATLMEEFFHLWLEHRSDRLRLLGNGNSKRSYDSDKEAEAYGSGAAALVPYKALKAMVNAGKNIAEIADHFMVSEQLVVFRIRVSKIRLIATPVI